MSTNPSNPNNISFAMWGQPIPYPGGQPETEAVANFEVPVPMPPTPYDLPVEHDGATLVAQEDHHDVMALETPTSLIGQLEGIQVPPRLKNILDLARQTVVDQNIPVDDRSLASLAYLEGQRRVDGEERAEIGAVLEAVAQVLANRAEAQQRRTSQHALDEATILGRNITVEERRRDSSLAAQQYTVTRMAVENLQRDTKADHAALQDARVMRQEAVRLRNLHQETLDKYQAVIDLYTTRSQELALGLGGPLTEDEINFFILGDGNERGRVGGTEPGLYDYVQNPAVTVSRVVALINEAYLPGWRAQMEMTKSKIEAKRQEIEELNARVEALQAQEERKEEWDLTLQQRAREEYLHQEDTALIFGRERELRDEAAAAVFDHETAPRVSFLQEVIDVMEANRPSLAQARSVENRPEELSGPRSRRLTPENRTGDDRPHRITPSTLARAAFRGITGK